MEFVAVNKLCSLGSAAIDKKNYSWRLTLDKGLVAITWVVCTSVVEFEEGGGNYGAGSGRRTVM